MKKVFAWMKSEVVLVIAWMLAVISAFFVLPDKQYLEYIDFRTLALLFCLMCVMAGLKKIGVFQWIAEALLAKVKNSGQLVLILVLLCFFFSMFITNDVALIVFVPFTFTVLRLVGQDKWELLLIPIVAMQTVAANLGSMLTPIGNPQNMYLCNFAGMGLGEFVLLMLPYTALSLVIFVVWGMIKGRRCKDTLAISFTERTSLKGKQGKLVAYLILFVLCLLTVAKIIPYVWVLAVVVVIVIVLDKKVLLTVDYSLLLTFVGFFIFTGNIGRIPAVAELLKQLISGQEMLTTVVACQVMSNVPAAILLSGFTENIRVLIVAVNIGGLGTLIASMASLISFKYVAREDGGRKGAYFLYFTLANICFLAALVVLYIISGAAF